MEPLRIICEGELSTVDSRLHVGGVALSDLMDHVPGRYMGPARASYGPGRVTIEFDQAVDTTHLVLPPAAEDPLAAADRRGATA